jgi:hypothetical protein
LEYPTNYHWLLAEICGIINNWADSFGENYYDNQRDYNSHIPYMFQLVMESLYVGTARGKISFDFLRSRIYYGILSTYFDLMINDEFKNQIEEIVIGKIPASYIKTIFDFALNERFAITYDDLKRGRYGHILHDVKVLKRLKEFLDTVDSGDTIILGYV